MRYYDVTAGGNFEGHNILNVARPDEAEHAALAEARRKLYEVRARRVPPLRDDKMLAAWNGLAISAFAFGGPGAGRSRATSRRPPAPPTSCSQNLRRGPPASMRGLEGRPGGAGRASWRTRPSWPRGCWICSRAPSTGAGCSEAIALAEGAGAATSPTPTRAAGS